MFATRAYGQNTTQGTIKTFCPHCGEVHDVKLVNKVARVNDSLILAEGRVCKAMLSIGVAKCEITGCEIELPPAVVNSYQVYNNDSESLSKCATDFVSESLLQTPLKDELNAKQKRNQGKKEYRDIVSSAFTVNTLVDYAKNTLVDALGNEVINPDYVVAHNGADIPLFLKTKCSAGLVVDMSHWFSFLAVTKSKIV